MGNVGVENNMGGAGKVVHPTGRSWDQRERLLD